MGQGRFKVFGFLVSDFGLRILAVERRYLHGQEIEVIDSWDEAELPGQVVVVDIEILQRTETGERGGHGPHEAVVV